MTGLARNRSQELYEEAFGTDGLARQPCCGEHRDGPHHEMCAKYVEPAPQVHADQIGLL